MLHGGKSASEIDAPEGYQLHSWHLTAYETIAVCWEPVNQTASTLAHIPTEWVAPTLEWVRRIIAK